MSEVVFEASSVLKKYGTKTALTDFSLTLNKGEVVALLGPNGAGKTTFVKSLLGLLKINSGSLSLFGMDIQSKQAKRRLAYLPEKFTFYSYYTVEGTLRFYANMYDVPKEQISENIDNSLRRLGIFELKGNKVSELSKGQLQRVGLACSIVGGQEFIIWDEPFSGLDPIGVKEVRDLSIDLKNEGRTVLINSHILAEMEKMADKIVILNHGQVKAVGSVSEVAQGGTLEDRFFSLIKGSESC
ncbi:ABC transporter ATP-binding protein [Bacteriovorax sp. DB6_IX]|uniref:ABC transporter ATP-binding protein n=1 Tax=Bacteriovorax sp. DB6_IX TaxID=1353530 RepID=UPI00038A407B|nr:ABC transporter ATP-binding protein [Bacteriovorax sp. DB6_IX]EQC52769.1 hydrolase, P-loop-like family protein [Bacteriovorax sp. DB6_IX]